MQRDDGLDVDLLHAVGGVALDLLIALLLSLAPDKHRSLQGARGQDASGYRTCNGLAKYHTSCGFDKPQLVAIAESGTMTGASSCQKGACVR